MMDELLDLVNEKDEIIGEVWKSNAHRDPKLIHREVTIGVFDRKGKVLLQQRGLRKSNDPGVWKITAAGHVGVGENPKVAIKREVLEEMGIEVEPVYFAKHFRVHNKSGQNKESRFFYIFYAILDKEVDPKIDKKEVEDARWVSVDDLTRFAEQNNYDLSGFSHEMIIKIYDFLKRKREL